MFNMDTDTGAIDMHRGDTGVVGITITGYTFAEDDRVVFTLKSPDGKIVKEGVYELDNGRFEVVFMNDETDYLDPGSGYVWDVRCVVNPIYDNAGKIINGDKVGTPKDPIPLNLRTTVGQV